MVPLWYHHDSFQPQAILGGDGVKRIPYPCLKGKFNEMKFMDLSMVKLRLNLGERMPENEQEVRRQEEALRESQVKFSPVFR